MQDKLLQHEKINVFIIFPDPFIIIPTYLYLNADGAISSGYAPLKIYITFVAKLRVKLCNSDDFFVVVFMRERIQISLKAGDHRPAGVLLAYNGDR